MNIYLSYKKNKGFKSTLDVVKEQNAHNECVDGDNLVLVAKVQTFGGIFSTLLLCPSKVGKVGASF